VAPAGAFYSGGLGVQILARDKVQAGHVLVDLLYELLRRLSAVTLGLRGH
jgi:hypothetical protein